MIKRMHTNQRMSQIVEYSASGGLVILAGQVSDDPSLDVQGQTLNVLAKIDRLLEEAGTNKERVISASVWLTDIGEFARMNEVWDAWVAPGAGPARACVEARLADPRLKVEIQVLAVKE